MDHRYGLAMWGELEKKVSKPKHHRFGLAMWGELEKKV